MFNNWFKLFNNIVLYDDVDRKEYRVLRWIRRKYYFKEGEGYKDIEYKVERLRVLVFLEDRELVFSMFTGWCIIVCN